ncbi:transcription factor Adf-1-like, partial [Aphis craccivora]
VHEVQNNRVLYDMAASDYKNIIIKDNIWKDIATKIEKSTDDTKKRWKNIRNSYSRNKRKPGIGSAASTKKKKMVIGYTSHFFGSS